MNEKNLRKAAEVFAAERMHTRKMTEAEGQALEERLLEAALQAKAERPLVKLQDALCRLWEHICNKPVWFAVPATAFASLALILALAFNTPNIQILPYQSTALPQVGISRVEDEAWTVQRQQEIFGWSEAAVLMGFTLKEHHIYPAVTAQSTEEAWMLETIYEDSRHHITIIHSQQKTPLFAVLSAGKPTEVEHQPVFFGRDETGSTTSAVWQNNGLTISVTGNVDTKTLVKIVKEVIQ